MFECLICRPVEGQVIKVKAKNTKLVSEQPMIKKKFLLLQYLLPEITTIIALNFQKLNKMKTLL